MKAVDGRQLRAARAALGLTFEQAGDMAGINRNSVMSAETINKMGWGNYAADRLSAAYVERGCRFGVMDGNVYVSFPEGLNKRDKEKRDKGHHGNSPY